jgi:signal recognition particle subunit SRP54
MRILYDQLANLQKLGPVGQIFGMIPGLSNAGLFGGGDNRDAESALRMKRFMTMMDSMTAAELDSANVKILADVPRILRIARGAGRPPGDVVELFEEYKRMRTAIVGAKGQGGLMKAMGKSMNARGGPSAAQMAQMQAHMGKMLPPHVLQQMGGAGALQVGGEGGEVEWAAARAGAACAWG